MRKMRMMLMIMLSFLVMAGTLGSEVYAAGLDNADLTYTITVYSGDSGTFADGTRVKKIEGLSYGDRVQLDIGSSELKPVVNSDVADKYYARGFKIAGHDNDEISQLQLVNYSHLVTGDESFTVAYGMKGGMVKYVVNYVDENGDSIHPAAEYYGMAGDRPVISYQYVEGYQPSAYNQSWWLSSDESENVFSFVYTAGNAGGAGGENGADDGAGDGNGGGAAGAAAADGNAGLNMANIGDNQTPQAETPEVAINDSDVPMTPGDSSGQGELMRQRRAGLAIGAVAAAALIAGIIVFLIRRKTSREETAGE